MLATLVGEEERNIRYKKTYVEMKEKKAEEKSLNKTVIRPSSKHSRKSMSQRKLVKIKKPPSKWCCLNRNNLLQNKSLELK